jgi:general secretion pathway protein D
VLVDNGEIVVLGGLLDQNEQVTQEKVPILGDIPFIGALFSSEQTQKDNTNLMIFIRPVIVGSVDAARSITQPELDRMIEQQRLNSGGAPSMLDDVLGRMPAAPALSAPPQAAATDGRR